MTIIDFKTAKEERDHHLSGDAKCLACKHEWMAVAPVGAVWMECPSCTLLRGRYIAHSEYPLDHWNCGCGCDLFHVIKDCFYCPNCGKEQHFEPMVE